MSKKRNIVPKFDASIPINFCNLSQLSKHKDNLRKNLLKAKERSLHEETRERALMDISRIERNLLQLEENHKLYYDHMRLFIDLTLIQSRLDEDSSNLTSINNITELLYNGLVGNK